MAVVNNVILMEYMGVGRCFMLGGPTTLYSACSKKQKLGITLAIMQNLLFSYKFSPSLPFQLWYFACCIVTISYICSRSNCAIYFSAKLINCVGGRQNGMFLYALSTQLKCYNELNHV